MQREYQVCQRCVMDTTDSNIIFANNGYCNHCTRALQIIASNYQDEYKNQTKLTELIDKVRKAGENNAYDCIIGLSGGVDSSYLAYVLVKQFNLRPLAIHVDNGWNSETAVGNIHALVSRLHIDLITHVIEWNEFKDLQKAFLRASVIDLEMLSDHAIVVVSNKIAREKKIQYFLIGSNYQTESIMPRNWFYGCKFDSGNIMDIHRKYGEIKSLKTFPYLSFLQFLKFNKFGYGEYASPLSLINYSKEKAKNILENEIGWQDYGAKHNESFITKFYQNYILPNKFGVDKRKAHLSSMICANQISRQDALLELEKPYFQSKQEETATIDYFCKKLELDRSEFERIMALDRREHWDFRSYQKRKIWIRQLIKGK